MNPPRAAVVVDASIAIKWLLDMNHSVYDCVYLALAADQSATLATADRRLREAATSAGVALWEA